MRRVFLLKALTIFDPDEMAVQGRFYSPIGFNFASNRQTIMLKALAIVFYEGLVDDHSIVGSLRAFQKLLAASRIMFFPDVIFTYKRLGILDKLYNPPRRWDPLYFAVYKFYLCKDLAFGERLQCAMSHYDMKQIIIIAISYTLYILYTYSLTYLLYNFNHKLSFLYVYYIINFVTLTLIFLGCNLG